MKTVNVNLLPQSMLLTLILIGLKIGGYINISWIWVFCPLWIGIAIVLAVLLVSILVMAFVALLAIIAEFLK